MQVTGAGSTPGRGQEDLGRKRAIWSSPTVDGVEVGCSEHSWTED